MSGLAATKVTKAVILARGVGKRMRTADSAAGLASEQSLAADTGVKGMIPIVRPFLDYVMSAVADAGFSEICLVIGPGHESMRTYYEREVSPARLRIHFAIQEKPLGTADAVLAAEAFAGDDLFAVLNSDNFYPPDPLRELRAAGGPAMAAFARSALVQGNVVADRLDRFGAVEMDELGFLRKIVGDPDSARASTGGEIYASMNCWLFDSGIFRACREVALSARGELELPQAVRFAIEQMGIRFKVILSRSAVLDLSSRGDIPSVAAHLAGVVVRL